jgi:hypothetical protein
VICTPLLAFTAAMAAAALAGSGGAGEAPQPPAPRVVLLELFTSQGCSSCPPADRLLSRLAGSPEWRGRVVPLAFHVDYWNSIGWRDPFSAPAWSERQHRYARALRNGRVYTPQAVIDGRVHLVGSDEHRVLAELAKAARAPGPAIELETRLTGRELIAEIAVGPAPGAVLARPLDLLVAVFESGLETEVTRGENARRTLRNDYVVRRLDRVARLDSAAPSRHRLAVALAAGWKPERLGAAVFLQDPETLAVAGAAAREPIGERLPGGP